MSLKRYRVTYFYLATGMGGRADERDYGEYVAHTREGAIAQAMDRHERDTPKATQDFVRGCLSAKRVKTN